MNNHRPLLRLAALLAVFALCVAAFAAGVALAHTSDDAQYALSIVLAGTGVGMATHALWSLRRVLVDWRESRRRAEDEAFERAVAETYPSATVPPMPTAISHLYINGREQTSDSAEPKRNVIWLHDADGEIVYSADGQHWTPLAQLPPGGGVYRYDAATGAWVRLAACERAGEESE